MGTIVFLLVFLLVVGVVLVMFKDKINSTIQRLIILVAIIVTIFCLLSAFGVIGTGWQGHFRN